jgi:hypothetical protein
VSFKQVLHAQEPTADLAAQLGLYSFLIGSWITEIVTYDSGKTHEGTGEIHAGWVLEGRAIQDVWMIPRRGLRTQTTPSLPIAGNWYGTTLRAFDPAIDAWRILWTDPATNNFVRQIGRAHGSDIVQEGEHVNGTPMRWSFTEITPTSFHWVGEVSHDDGASWVLQVEVFAERA